MKRRTRWLLILSWWLGLALLLAAAIWSRPPVDACDGLPPLIGDDC